MAETGSPYARVPQDAQGTGVPSAGAGAPSPRLSVGEPSPRRSSVSSWRGSESEVPGSWQPEEAEAQPSIVRNVSEYFQVKPVLIYRLAMAVAVVIIIYITVLLVFFRGLAPGQCGSNPCPVAWASGGQGGYFCEDTRGCRPAVQGPFPSCLKQCWIGNTPVKTFGKEPKTSTGGGTHIAPKPSKPSGPGSYDLRMVKQGKVVGCMAPISLIPGDPRYGCSGRYGTASTCDAATSPVKDTKYVAAVHRGCATEQGQGTYGYAYDDGVGLKQCPPMTLYEWILCPRSEDQRIEWSAEDGPDSSTKRFRVTNHCNEDIWIQSTGAEMPYDDSIVKIESGRSYAYSVPQEGVPSTRFLPKTGCDQSGNNCHVQSVPPCPADGCSPPIDTKFEASFGCMLQPTNITKCAKTGQGQPSTYQDWWDGSAVDGWTLPFSILTNDGGWSLAPGQQGSSSQCGDVRCAKLSVEELCPRDEWLSPSDSHVVA